MKLIRLATIHVTNSLADHWESCTLSLGDITTNVVSVFPGDAKRVRILVAAMVPINEFQLDADGFVKVPDCERQAAERAIETLANLISVFEQTPRQVSSASPFVAFLANADQMAKLDASNGMRFNHIIAVTPHIRLSDRIAVQYIADRLDGLALMAEALSCEHATGRLHEFLRVFERAFTKSSTQLVEPLSTYLSGAYGKFTEDEVKQWVVDIRHPATHADRMSDFITEAQTRRVIGRIEEAAYDVLLNKSVWRNTCVQRRDLWKPSCGTTSVAGDLFVRKGEEGIWHSQLLDPFGAYPIDLDANLSSLPTGWWANISNQ